MKRAPQRDAAKRYSENDGLQPCKPLFPNPFNAIGIQANIAAQNTRLLNQALCHKEAIEWVAMVER